MPRITIREQDLTTARSNLSASDVAFVLGFVSDLVAPEPALAAPLQPVYCETLNDFTTKFGRTAPVFATAQSYEYAAGQTYWGENAVPADKTMIPAGGIDYGYEYATRLLSLGIPVVYVRVNGNVGTLKGSVATSNLPVASASNLGDVYNVTDAATAYQICVYDSETSTYSWEPTNAGTSTAGLTYVQTPSIIALYDAMLGTVENSHLDSIFYSVIDQGAYSIKYLTSGGYPTFEYNKTATNKIVDIMLKVASDLGTGRGDCVALIDHTNNPARSVNPDDATSVYKCVNNAFVFTASDSMGDFGAVFTPWCSFNTTRGTAAVLAGSYAYLTALGSSIASNGNWLAIAGVNRGRSPYLIKPATDNVITNTIADAYSSTNIAINAITEIKPYGYTIWGNRTLRANAGVLTAASFLNIRNMISDVKKVAYSASRSLMFEQNNEILWINFKSKISPLLDQLVTGYGISKYKLTRIKSTADRTALVAKITIYPVYAVESFDITIELRDEEAE